MDKHYGWQEGRGSQTPQGRMQNGQRWNERYRDDDRDVSSSRGGDGWEEDDRQWTSTGGNLDREDYSSEREEFGGRSRGGYNQGQRFVGQGSAGRQNFSGGHYGGYANEGFPGQGNYGGNRGFSNQGYSGQRSNQGGLGQQRRFAGQGTWSQGGWGRGGQDWGQRFGQGYAGGDDGSMYQGRGFAGRGPKGYQRSDDRVKEQLSDRLMDDDDIDASEISIEVKNGEVTLTGTVGSREEKRAAEEIAEQSPGVREVQNLLRVSRDTSSASTQFGQSGRTGSTGHTGGASSSGSRQDSATGQSKSRSTERE